MTWIRWAVQGENILSGIDIDLQEYGEKLMKNKTGSIVAIEPKTGEVLTLVSAPNYSPELLVGRIRSENFAKLQADTLWKPLYNRALMPSYPPGSTFKPITGLIGLQEKVISSETTFGCNNGYMFVGCHTHSSPLDFVHGISNSCNSYFCQTFRRIIENQKYGSVYEAFNKWMEYINEFGSAPNWDGFVTIFPDLFLQPVILTNIMVRRWRKAITNYFSCNRSGRK